MMRKKPQEPKEQLNKQAPVVVETEEVYSLEDIMREFGGWSNWDEPDPAPAVQEPKPEPEPAPLPEPEVKRELPLVVKSEKKAKPEKQSEPKPEPEKQPEPEKKPEPKPEARPAAEPESETVRPPVKIVTFEREKKPPVEIMRVAAETPPEKPKPRFKLVDLSGDTISFQTVKEEDLQEPIPEPKGPPVEMPEEPAKPEPDRKQEREEDKARRRTEQRLKKQEAQRRKAQKQALRAARREEPEVVYPSPENACAAYAKAGTLRLRLLVNAVLFAVSAGLLLLTQYPLFGIDLSGSRQPFSLAMMALLLCQCVLSYETFIRGVYQALRLRPDLMSLLVLTTVVVLADGFFAIPQARVPFCTGAALCLLLAQWSVSLDKKAKWRTLKTVLSMETPVAAVKEEKAWHGLDCVFRREGSLQDFTAMLETPDAAQKVMRVYVPVAAVLTVVLAIVAVIRSDCELLWAWSALLLAAVPGGGFIACCRPFSILANRLHQAGACNQLSASSEFFS